MLPGTSHPLQALMGRAGGRVIEALRVAPDAGVHVRELARGAQLSASSLQRELKRFSALGLLSRAARGNRVTHRLYREEPLLRLLLAAATAAELRGRRFDAMPGERETEHAFINLCAHLPPQPELWRQYGDGEFLAGVAVALSGHTGFDRAAYLALAQTLHAGAATARQHQRWYLKYRPGLPRLFSMVDRERHTHARVEDQ